MKNLVVRSARVSPPFAPRRAAGANTSWRVRMASAASGVKVTVVESALHENAPVTGSCCHGRSTNPASTDERSIGWLKLSTIGVSNSTCVASSCGVMAVTAGWMVAKLQVKSDIRTPSVAAVRPAGMRTAYSVLGARSVGMKR